MKFKITLESNFSSSYNRPFKAILKLFQEHKKGQTKNLIDPQVYLHFNNNDQKIKFYYLFDAIPATVTISKEFIRESIYKCGQKQNEIFIRIVDYQKLIKFLASDLSIKQISIDLQKQDEQRFLRISIGSSLSAFKIDKPVRLGSIQADSLFENKWFQGVGVEVIKFSLTKEMCDVLQCLVRSITKKANKVDNMNSQMKAGDQASMFVKLIANQSLLNKYEIAVAMLKRKYKNKSKRCRGTIFSRYKKFIQQFNQGQEFMPPYSLKIQHIEPNQTCIYPKNIQISNTYTSYLKYRYVFKVCFENVRILIKATQLFGSNITFSINTQGQLNILQQLKNESDDMNKRQKLLEIGLFDLFEPHIQTREQIQEQRRKQTVIFDYFNCENLLNSYNRIDREVEGIVSFSQQKESDQQDMHMKDDDDQQTY